MSLIKASFDYLIYHLALRYIDDTNPNNSLSVVQKLGAFNQNNDFGIKKVSLYPFIITIGNGNRVALLTHFNREFVPLSFGIVQKQIHSDLQKSTWGTNVIQYDNYSCVFNTPHILHNRANAIQVIAQAHNINTDQLDSIAQKMEESVDFIIKKKIGNFASCPLETLTYWSTSGLVFNAYQKFYEDSKVDTEDPAISPLITILFNQSLEHANFSLSFG